MSRTLPCSEVIIVSQQLEQVTGCCRKYGIQFLNLFFIPATCYITLMLPNRSTWNQLNRWNKTNCDWNKCSQLCTIFIVEFAQIVEGLKTCLSLNENLPKPEDGILRVKRAILINQTEEEKKNLQTMIKVFIKHGGASCLQEALHYSKLCFLFRKISSTGIDSKDEWKRSSVTVMIKAPYSTWWLFA